MTADIHVLDIITRLDIPPERVLQEALKNSELLEGVLVIGLSKQGELYLAGSKASVADAVFMLEQAKIKFLDYIDPLPLMGTIPLKQGS